MGLGLRGLRFWIAFLVWIYRLCRGDADANESKFARRRRTIKEGSSTALRTAPNPAHRGDSSGVGRSSRRRLARPGRDRRAGSPREQGPLQARVHAVQLPGKATRAAPHDARGGLHPRQPRCALGRARRGRALAVDCVC
jgi:hypothetical protein